MPKRCVMRSLPKPLIGLLLGTVAFFAVWMVALKPSSSSSGGSPSGVGQYQSAINQAHQAVKTSHAGKAVKLAVPVSRLSQDSIVTRQIPVVRAGREVGTDARLYPRRRWMPSPSSIT